MKNWWDYFVIDKILRIYFVYESEAIKIGQRTF